MKPAYYKTETAAARYASELAAIFPKRQFKAVVAGFTGFNVGMFNDGVLIALAGKRKRNMGQAKETAQ